MQKNNGKNNTSYFYGKTALCPSVAQFSMYLSQQGIMTVKLCSYIMDAELKH